MSSKKRVALVACGSYNPITNMHLRLFELARDQLNCTDKYRVVAGIISPVSDYYPKKDLVSAEHRCAMVQLALQSSDWIRLETWESDQNEWSETVKVLRHFRDQLQHMSNTTTHTELIDGVATKKRKIDANNKNYIAAVQQQRCEVSSGPVEVKMLCGGDVLESFAVPGLWKPEHMEEIVSQFGIVVCTRAGSDVEKFIYESDLLTKYKNNIEIVREWMTNDISSTKIRRAVRRGESIRYLMQDSVIEYISRHHLYTAVTDNSTTDNSAIDLTDCAAIDSAVAVK
jgi:nicotinamide mononucleotide adenylyltransferase